MICTGHLQVLQERNLESYYDGLGLQNFSEWISWKTDKEMGSLSLRIHM
jgi:hypothetical protein